MNTLYVIHAKSTSRYKIGFTSRSAEKRLAQLQTACPFELKVVLSHKLKRAREVESALHIHFDDQNVSGEWFLFEQDPGSVVYKIRDLCLRYSLMETLHALEEQGQNKHPTISAFVRLARHLSDNVINHTEDLEEGVRNLIDRFEESGFITVPQAEDARDIYAGNK